MFLRKKYHLKRRFLLKRKTYFFKHAWIRWPHKRGTHWLLRMLNYVTCMGKYLRLGCLWSLTNLSPLDVELCQCHFKSSNLNHHHPQVMYTNVACIWNGRYLWSNYNLQMTLVICNNLLSFIHHEVKLVVSCFLSCNSPLSTASAWAKLGKHAVVRRRGFNYAWWPAQKICCNTPYQFTRPKSFCMMAQP